MAKRSTRVAVGVSAAMSLLALATGRASAQLVSATIPAPVVDRWMYPFGSEVGTRATVPVFSSANRCGPDARFDDRDAQMLVTFATAGTVEAGWPIGAYRVLSARLRVRSSDATAFAYDPTPDAIETYLASGDAGVPCGADAAYVVDSDPGRPIEAFAVAFRNGFSAATYGESSPFKPGSAFVPPWIDVRNAYPVAFDEAGAGVDASNPIKARVLVPGLATGVAASAAPGAVPADGTEFAFAFDLSRPGTSAYVAQGLASGRVALLVAALFDAEQEVIGSYPNFYTKEAEPFLFPNAAAPALDFDVFLCKADLNGDGTLDPDDLSDYIAAYFAVPSDPRSDFNRDGNADPDDLSDYIAAYFGGCG